jgi:hypothetical protein|tara:strand:+ start:165 stop:539 length:375 start_codon:yes stop_codon:yes gene_type:complete
MKLDEDSFLLYAAKCYDMKMAISAEEFYDDLRRFQHLKRLFKRYEEDDDLKVRLILNHLIVIYNCFGPGATTMLFFKLEEYHKCLKPFIIMLNYMPEVIEYSDKRIMSSEIPLDERIVEELRKL